jgi:uncharacterized protein YjbI with pentapeptide repeats
MLHRKVRARTLSAMVCAGIACGGLMAVGGSAQAAGCPTVSASGTVTPAPAPGVAWNDCSLAGANLSGADLAGANLSGANLTGANLSGADLTGASLYVADLNSANLSDATLTNAYLFDASINSGNLSGANLSGATLRGVYARTITGTPAALPQDWALLDGDLVGPYADLRSANFAFANLSGYDLASADLIGTELHGANLAGTDFTDANLAGAHLDSADISGANLTGANLSFVYSGGTTAATPPTLPANWALLGGYLLGPKASLSGANLTGLDLAGTDLASATLTGADLTGLDLSGVNLTGASIANATIAGTALPEATNLTGIKSGGLTGTPASLPQNFSVVGGYLAGPGVDLAAAALSGANLAGYDLAGVNLQSANLDGANLAGADLAQVTAPQANLTGANLSGADVGSANFSSATLTSADLDTTDFSTATLNYVISGGVTGVPSALPANWKVADGYLVGPRANLNHASLSGADLSGVDLEAAFLNEADLSSANLTAADLRASELGSANLTSADLSGASLYGAQLFSTDLTNADLANADLSWASLQSPVMSGANFANANLYAITYDGAGGTGTPAVLPSHYFLAYGYLISNTVTIRGASLRGADLQGDDFFGVQLLSSDLTNANLDDANLTQASLMNDTVTGATFAGATWGYTTCPDDSNSSQHVSGCFSPLDTTPPVVTVTGVGNGKTYVTGAVPKAGCKTTDNGTVSDPATVKVTTTGKNGVGRFTATCSGAADLAGNRQKAPVSVTYTVVYGLHGFIAPANGATIARSSKRITVRLRLTSANGAAISASLAKALAAAHDVRATLQGPAIKAVTVYCGWNASQQDLTCAIGIPSGVRTGSSQRYTLTATENVGTGFLTVPAVRGTADPEVIHFR